MMVILYTCNPCAISCAILLLFEITAARNPLGLANWVGEDQINWIFRGAHFWCDDDV